MKNEMQIFCLPVLEPAAEGKKTEKETLLSGLKEIVFLGF